MSDMQHTSNKDEPLQMMQDMCKRDVDDMLMSPLAVNTDDMIVVTMPPLEFRYFDESPDKIKIQNNGLTVTLDGLWAANRQPCIAGANLDGIYNFSHLHFHWTDVDGGEVVNEHIINGRGHELEMHMMFFKGSCQTMFEAESIKNGFVTLAYLFNVTENQSFGVNNITTYLNNVRKFGQTARIPVFPLSDLIHDQPSEYFTYYGKIDRRGCKCGVTQWMVFTQPCDVNREQVNQFRCMLDKHGHAINRNYRKANPVPPGNVTRPILVVLDGYENSWSDGEVALAVDEVAAGSRSVGLRQTSVRRPLTVVTSTASRGNPSRTTLCVKPTKTQLLRRMFNLKKLSTPQQWQPTLKAIAITEPAVQKTDADNENLLRPTCSFNATRPSWK